MLLESSGRLVKVRFNSCVIDTGFIDSSLSLQALVQWYCLLRYYSISQLLPNWVYTRHITCLAILILFSYSYSTIMSCILDFGTINTLAKSKCKTVMQINILLSSIKSSRRSLPYITVLYLNQDYTMPKLYYIMSHNPHPIGISLTSNTMESSTNIGS